MLIGKSGLREFFRLFGWVVVVVVDFFLFTSRSVGVE